MECGDILHVLWALCSFYLHTHFPFVGNFRFWDPHGGLFSSDFPNCGGFNIVTKNKWRHFKFHIGKSLKSCFILWNIYIALFTRSTECRTLCLSLGLPSPMTKEVTKNEIKHANKTKIREECIKRMQAESKSKDRVDLNPD